MNFAVPAGHTLKINESEKIHTHLDLARELKKKVEYAGDGDTNWSWCTWNGLQKT